MKKNTNSLERSLICCLGASVVSPPFSIEALLSLTLSITELSIEELQCKHVADISSLEKIQYIFQSSGNSALSQSENSENMLVSCSSEYRATIVVS
jgi:hypothetical protein